MENLFTISIIIITVLVSFIGFRNVNFFENYLFSTRGILKEKEIHRTFTSMFLHADWAHLAFNMFSFYSFANNMEYQYGAAVVALIYLASGIAGSLFSLTLHKKELKYKAIGASGAVSGIIFSSIFLLPGGKIIIFPLPIPIPSWAYALIFVAVSIYGMGRDRDNIGHDAHLGGAIAGVVICLLLYPALVIQNWLLLVGISAAILFFFLFRNKLGRRM